MILTRFLNVFRRQNDVKKQEKAKTVKTCQKRAYLT